MTTPFTGPNLKALWGTKHTERLANTLSAFENGRPYKAVPVRNGVGVDFVGHFPPEIPLILGDAIHNLRTALDLLACDLVQLNQKSPKGVYFPFAESAEGLEDQIKAKKFNRASPKAVGLLREIKPYRGGNVMLRALHELDVMDKHQLIIPVNHSNHIEHLEIVGENGGAIKIQGVSMTGGATIGVGTNPKVKSEKIQTHTIFGPNSPDPLAGREVLKTLEQMAQLVLGIIKAFETLIVGNRTQNITPPGQYYSFGVSVIP